MSDKDKIEYLEQTVIARERQIAGLASIIRAITKSGISIPSAQFDYTLTPEEARVLGISNWQKSVAP